MYPMLMTPAGPCIVVWPVYWHVVDNLLNSVLVMFSRALTSYVTLNLSAFKYFLNSLLFIHRTLCLIVIRVNTFRGSLNMNYLLTWSIIWLSISISYKVWAGPMFWNVPLKRKKMHAYNCIVQNCSVILTTTHFLWCRPTNNARIKKRRTTSVRCGGSRTRPVLLSHRMTRLRLTPWRVSRPQRAAAYRRSRSAARSSQPLTKAPITHTDPCTTSTRVTLLYLNHHLLSRFWATEKKFRRESKPGDISGRCSVCVLCVCVCVFVSLPC